MSWTRLGRWLVLLVLLVLLMMMMMSLLLLVLTMSLRLRQYRCSEPVSHSGLRQRH
jgi:hypothetical protein